MQVLECSTLYRPPSLASSVHCEARVSFNFESLSHPELLYFQMVMGYGFIDMDMSQRQIMTREGSGGSVGCIFAQGSFEVFSKSQCA